MDNTINKNQPLQTFKEGLVKINLWQQGNDQTRFAVAAISKSYQDKRSGQWREGKNFSAKDMERLQQMLPQAQAELSKWNEYYREANKQYAQQPSPQQPSPQQSVPVHQTEPLQSHPMQAMPAEQPSILTAQRPADIVKQHQQQMIAARDAAMQAAQASQQQVNAQTNIQEYAPTQTQEPIKSRP